MLILIRKVQRLVSIERIINELNVPVQKGDWKGANARRDAVKAIFENLSPDQAKELYSRLENYNWKDTLNDRFHGNVWRLLNHVLKQTLKSALNRKMAELQQRLELKSPVPRVEQRRNRMWVMSEKRVKTSWMINYPERSRCTSKNRTEQRYGWNYKGPRDHEAIRTATPADFQKMVEQSTKWPKDVQDRFDKEIAGGFGDLAKRIPTDLKPDQQIEMVKRLHSAIISMVLLTLWPVHLQRSWIKLLKIINLIKDLILRIGQAEIGKRSCESSTTLITDNRAKLADDIYNDPKVLPDNSYRASNKTTMFDAWMKHNRKNYLRTFNRVAISRNACEFQRWLHARTD